MLDQVKSFFESGTWYETSRYSIQIRSEVVQRFLRDYEFSSVLDVGCGDGSVTFPLLKKHRRVTLLDASEKVLAIAKSRVPKNYLSFAEFRNEDILSAELHDPYDVVICVGALAHVERPYDVLQKLAQLTRNGGVLIIQNTNSRHFRSRWLRQRMKIADHRRYSFNWLSDADIRRFLVAHGHVLEKVYRYGLAPPGFGRIFSQESLYRQARKTYGTVEKNVNTWLANEFIYCFKQSRKHGSVMAHQCDTTESTLVTQHSS